MDKVSCLFHRILVRWRAEKLNGCIIRNTDFIDLNKEIDIINPILMLGKTAMTWRAYSLRI